MRLPSGEKDEIRPHPMMCRGIFSTISSDLPEAFRIPVLIREANDTIRVSE